MIVSIVIVKLTMLVLDDFDHQRKFDQFIATYNKTYAKDVNETEYYRRFRNFQVFILFNSFWSYNLNIETVSRMRLT